MKAISISKPNAIGVVETDDPRPKDNEVRIKVDACGICGTDIHIYRGEYLGDYPIIPGHEFAGTIVEAGQGITRFKEGERVAVEPNISCNNCVNCLNNRQNFCLNWRAIGVLEPGGMAEFVCAPEEATFGIGDLDFERGAFVEPLSCVLHGIERANPRLSDRILILGAGPIGLLLLQTARLRGAGEIAVVDKNEARLQKAEGSGATETFANLEGIEEESYDVVIDATGAPSVMRRTLDFARKGGTILLFGVAPAGSLMEIEPFKIFRKGLTILSSFTSLRNSFQAVKLLETGLVDVSQLISHRLPLQEMKRGIELIEQGREQAMKVLIKPQE
jgi:2-desacetyl-2-hydroxyethyl bacteriochlorophyllide A dehydrogenase